MEFRILDRNFVDKLILSNYESILWVDRYNECGDFEIYTPPTDDLLEAIEVGGYVYYKDSEHMMIIEHVELTTSYEEGPRLIIKGRSLESILDRRILWYKTQFRNNLEDGIRQILDYSIIHADRDIVTTDGTIIPANPDRKIDNFIFEYSNDPTINRCFVNAEYEIGTDLLTVISEMCQSVNVGFKITLNSNNQFVFKLYNGENRSYTQDANPWVVFAYKYHNLKTTQFSNDSTEFKNCVRTVGQSINEQAPIDFVAYQGERSNLLDLSNAGSGIGTDDVVVQVTDSDSAEFTFTNGALTVGQTYLFTSKVIFNIGSPSTIHLSLQSTDGQRVYASADPQIQNGRIKASLHLTRPTAGYDDCEQLSISVGAGIELSIVNPILSIGEEITKITGLDRREIYNDASNVELTEEMEQEADLKTYKQQLLDSAYSVLDTNIMKTEVNGEIEAGATYQYGRDFFIGDVVQVENEYGILGTMRVTEFITSHSTSGIEMYPTFNTTGGTK